MFHLELFSSAVASGATAFQQLTYVAQDAILQKLNNGVQVPQNLPFIHSVMGVGAHLVGVRAQAPSMLPLPYISLSQNNRGGAFESPPRAWDFSAAPVPLRLTEEMDIFVTQNSGGSETEYVAVNFSDMQTQAAPQPVTAVTMNGNGRFFTVHATGTNTVVGGQWNQLPASAFTFDQPFPAGAYLLVGVRALSATGLFFRMFPQQAPLWRPGGVCVQAYDQMDMFNQRYLPNYGPPGYGWGVWMQFFSNTPPGIEFYTTGNDTAQEIWYDCIKVSDATLMGTV